MKRFIKIFCCAVAITLLLTACKKQLDKPKGEKPDEPTEPPVPSPILVDADGKACCTVVKPNNCSDVLADAINGFLMDVERKTRVMLPVAEENDTVSTPYEIVINATAGRPFVEEQLAGTEYTDYVISVWEQHITVTSHSDIAAAVGLEKLFRAIQKNDGGYCIDRATSLRESVLLGEKTAVLPLYDTQNGTTLPLYSVNGGYEVCVQNTTPDEVAGYLEKLSSNGFSRYCENTINNNETFVYTAEDVTAFLNYDVQQGTLRIVCEHAGALPSLQKPTCTDGDTATVSIAQIGIGGLGMSYVVQLKDHSFIVIDGGTNADENVTQLYEYMAEKTPVGKTPTIACWFFTHADPDHIGAPQAFLSKCKGHVALEAVAYNFPDCSVQNTSQDDQKIGASILALESLIQGHYDATTYNLHTGQRLYFKGCEVEILLTEENVYPRKPANYNDTSLVMRFTFDNGKTFMMLGDSTEKNSKQLAATFGAYLKSDILQLAHHGLIGGDKQLYQYIDPDICFWSTSKERFDGNYDTNKDGKVTAADVQHCLGQGNCDYNAYIRDESIRARTHYHGGQTFVITIDE